MMAWLARRADSRLRIVCGSLIATAVVVVGLTIPSFAFAKEAPAWKIVAVTIPTHLVKPANGIEPPNELVVTAVNVGGAATDGSKITISDSLPAGLVATGISGEDVYSKPAGLLGHGKALECSSPPVLTCTRTAVVDTGDQLALRIRVAVEPGAPESVVNEATVSGGGAEEGTSVRNTAIISATPASFGFSPGSVFAIMSTLQAGAHPDVTTGFTVNTYANASDEFGNPLGVPAADPRDIRFDLPPGLVGNTVGMPQCPAGEAARENKCSLDTVVGVASVTVNYNAHLRVQSISSVYNVAPSPGEPAAFVFTVSGLVGVRLDTTVLSNGDYGVRVTASNLSQGAAVLSTYITFWGVPADHEGPGATIVEEAQSGDKTVLGGPSANTRVPLLSSPSQCSSPLTVTGETDSWRDPGVFDAQSSSVGTLTGCSLLNIEPTFSMLPDTLETGVPAGYSFDLNVPQNREPDALAVPDVKDVRLALPVGTVVSPSAAWGLKACSDADFGLHSGATSDCPREAQVGTVQVKTPALEEALTGDVYLAEPLCNPCSSQDAEAGRMVRLFVQVVSEGRGGIIVKLEGTGQVNSQTGQITTSFLSNPQLPFSQFKLTLGGGPRATLANPRTCGVATSDLDMTPWSAPFAGDSTWSSPFEINQDCFGPQFKPSFVAGTTNIQAGEYTPFTLSFGRTDQDQFLNGLQLQMPAGLLGSLSGVPLCREPQAAQGTCPSESLIGHTQVLTGPGADPFLVTGGQVFLTEGYKGAPFGLSIVVPAKAGPYTLAGTTGTGTVVVRAAINIDPHTAALTVTSDPLPTMLDGIPLQLRVVNVTIDRPGFTFNPTSCAKLQIKGTMTSTESPGVTVSSPFQVTNCAGLLFDPKFKVSTSGHTSRANGASLDAKVIYPTGAQGSVANIAKVKVSLPRQLPSRLTTLQKACPAATFEANPSACPPGSVVGIAKADTPILPVGLTGPVYFVSHGGEAFPNLIVVLQGYGVRFDLIGDTFISKAGITSSTFNNAPDVPINSFELFLPEGRDSALAASGNLCTVKGGLKMPTIFTAQNGKVLRQSTPITVTGCATKTVKAAKKKAHKASRARKSSTNRGVQS
ncbi:MAG: hypothetical protein WBV85_04565 [Solirubrobacteraceae bacterium]